MTSVPFDAARFDAIRRRDDRILNCIPSPVPERDWGIGAAMQADALAGAAPELPDAVDLRAKWWDIGDQGQTGSCVGWATADGLLRYHFTKARRLKRTQRLSVRYLWMAAKETDEFNERPTTFIEPDGTSLKAALNIVRSYGIVADDILPFDTGALYAHDAPTFYTLAAKLRIATYHNLRRNLDDWRQWLAGQGPILTRLVCDDTWMQCGPDGALLQYDKDTADGGHAVCIVGYTPDHFIVRNSWGTTLWGDHGFAYATMDYAADAFVEAYGITI